jgi:DNA repair exonuclease SbcCD ATPase subunit
MSRVELKRVQISGFRSFRDSAEIVFDNSGIVCLQGRDIRTGGSNGSGKSSIFEAVYWIIGANKLPATELKNYQSLAMSGTLDLAVDGKLWSITRTSTKLSLTIDGVAVQGMKSELESQIEKALGGNLEIFEALSYKRQMDLGKFFYMEDSKLKSFLSQCIPELDKLETVSGEAGKKASQIENEIAVKTAAFNALKAQLDTFPEISQSNIEALESELGLLRSNLGAKKGTDPLSLMSKEDTETLAGLTDKLKVLTTYVSPVDLENTPEVIAKIENLEKKKEELVSNLDIGRFKESCSAIDSQISVLEATIRQMQDKEREMALKAQDLTSTIQKIKTLSDAVSHLAQQKCPTCLQNWSQAAAKLEQLRTERGGLMEYSVSLDTELKSAPNYKELKSKVNEDVSGLRLQKESITADYNRKKADVEKIDLELSSVRSASKQAARSAQEKVALEIKIANGQIDTIRQKYESQIQLELSDLRSTEKAIESQIASARNEISRRAKLEGSIHVANSEIAELAKQRDLESNISKILGRQGVLGLFFDDLISEIESEANTILSDIPNTSDISISISSASTTQSGTTKTKITTTITKSGHNISFRSLSGGQRATLSLAADLAMMNAINKRTNVRSGWIALDEAMDGMDIASKEAAVGAIRRYASGELVLMIDHATEIKELFDDIVNVEFDGATSRIV